MHKPSILKDIIIDASYKRLLKEKYNYIRLFNTSSKILESLPLQKIFKYSRWMKGCKGEHYIHFNIPKIIGEAYAECTVGAGFELVIEDEKISEEMRARLADYETAQELREKIFTAVVEMSYIGLSILRHREGEEGSEMFKTICLPIGYYMPGGRPEVGDSFRDLERHLIINGESDSSNILRSKIISYELENGKRDIYEQVSNKYFGRDTQLEQNMVHTPHDISDRVKKTKVGLEELPLIFFNNATVCNYVDEGDVHYGIGESDIRPVYDLILDINTMLTNISIEFIKNGESIKSYPRDMVEYINKLRKNGEFEKVEEVLGANVVTHTSDGVTQYVQKNLEAIEKMYAQIRNHITRISSVTGVPLEYFEEHQGGANESGEAKRERSKKFIAKCETKRNLLSPVLRKLYYLILKSFDWQGSINDIRIERSDPFQIAADTNKVIQACDKGLISKRTATRMLFDFSDEELEEELERINSDLLVNAHITGEFRTNRLGEL